MITKAPILTQAGQNMLIRAISGDELIFTCFKIGNGSLPDDSNGAELTDLINPLVSFGISDIDKSESGFLKINGRFDSTDVSLDFQWRELGLFAKIDDEEILYCYINDGDNAGMLRANESDVLAEQNITLVIAIGESENVTAILSEGTLYATKEELNSHVKNEMNPHKVTKAQIGLGEVPNVSTNNQTPTYTKAEELSALSSGEKLSTAFGKIAVAVESLITHLKDKKNPHKVTLSQIKAAAEKHGHSAADITSGALGINRGGTGATTASEAESKIMPVSTISRSSFCKLYSDATERNSAITIASSEIKKIGKRINGTIIFNNVTASPNCKLQLIQIESAYRPSGSHVGIVNVMTFAGGTYSARCGYINADSSNNGIVTILLPTANGTYDSVEVFFDYYIN